jgi:hypothetical protein
MADNHLAEFRDRQSFDSLGVGLYTLFCQHRGSSLISATSGLPGYVDKSVKTGNPAILLFGTDRDDEKVVLLD